MQKPTPVGEISAAKCRCTLCHHLVATFLRRWSPARCVYLGMPEIKPHAVAENEVCRSKFDQSSSETCYTTVESYQHVWLCTQLFWKAAKQSFTQEIFERFNIFSCNNESLSSVTWFMLMMGGRNRTPVSRFIKDLNKCKICCLTDGAAQRRVSQIYMHLFLFKQNLQASRTRSFKGPLGVNMNVNISFLSDPV